MGNLQDNTSVSISANNSEQSGDNSSSLDPQKRLFSSKLGALICKQYGSLENFEVCMIVLDRLTYEIEIVYN